EDDPDHHDGDDGHGDDHDGDGGHDDHDDDHDDHGNTRRRGLQNHDDDHDDHDDGHDHTPGPGPSPTTTHGHHPGPGPSPTTTHGHHPGPGPTTTTTHGHGHGTTTTTHGHDPGPDPGEDWAAIRLAALTGHLPPDKIAEFRAKAIDHLAGEVRARSQLLAGLPPAEREQRIDTFVTWSVDHALEAENGGHAHGPEPWIPITDPDDQRALQLQLAAAGRVIGQFPTAADAVRAGYVQVTPYVPGIAAHYMNFQLADRRFDPSQPEMLLFNGNDPTSELVGVSYAMFGEEPSESDGFVGPNDTWHEHPSLCTIGVFVVGPDHTPDDLCASVGGSKLRDYPLWMSHLWQVPGWESAWGLFSGENPAINMATSDLMKP
ncbi:MAG TPA: hypothetical protein VIL36_08835, partial [Acidimicrobiales bacterium]